MKEINFDNPKPGRQKKQKAKADYCDSDDEVDFDEDDALRSLKRICPTACALMKDDSDTDTVSEYEDMPPVSKYSNTY